MARAFIVRLSLPAAFLLSGTIGLMAQQTDFTPDESASSSSADSTEPAPGQPAYTPLDLKQKYLYSINEIFGISPLLAIAAHAALDQAGVRPAVWGRTPQSFAVRIASHFGDSLLRHNVEFGVRALDHEDPRYFRSGQGNGWQRAKYAVVHTFVVHNDNGRMMPAYSLFVTDYGVPFVVSQWRPHALSGLESGTLGIGIGMGTNLFHEFLPDLKKSLPKSFTRGPLSRFALADKP